MVSCVFIPNSPKCLRWMSFWLVTLKHFASTQLPASPWLMTIRAAYEQTIPSKNQKHFKLFSVMCPRMKCSQCPKKLQKTIHIVSERSAPKCHKQNAFGTNSDFCCVETGNVMWRRGVESTGPSRIATPKTITRAFCYVPKHNKTPCRQILR